jgi:hypothetical protein
MDRFEYVIRGTIIAALRTGACFALIWCTPVPDDGINTRSTTHGGERVLAMTKQQRLAREISKHKGEWVLVKDARVVAASPSIKKAINSLPKADRSKVTAQFCPNEDYTGSSFSAL